MSALEPEIEESDAGPSWEGGLLEIGVEASLHATSSSLAVAVKNLPRECLCFQTTTETLSRGRRGAGYVQNHARARVEKMSSNSWDLVANHRPTCMLYKTTGVDVFDSGYRCR